MVRCSCKLPTLARRSTIEVQNMSVRTQKKQLQHAAFEDVFTSRGVPFKLIGVELSQPQAGRQVEINIMVMHWT